MATIKITKRDNFMALSALVSSSEVANKDQLLDFIAHEVDLLDRKASKASGTVSKTAQANALAMERIVKDLATLDNAVTISEFMEKFGNSYITDEGKPFSNQKFSALFSQLVKAGKIERTIIKKKSYFSLVEVEDIDEGEENTTDNIDIEITKIF